MTDSLLLPVRRRRRIDSIRWAVALTLGACASGSSDAAPITAPQAVAVLTSVSFEASASFDTLRVGDSLAVWVSAFDQHGQPIGYESLDQQSSDSTVANIVGVPAQPWDYGDDYDLVATAPGTAVLTATVSAGDRSVVTTKSITVLPATSP